MLIGGLAFIYVGLHWHDLLPQPEISGAVTALHVAQNPASLQIPSLGISAPMIYSKASQESDIQTELESGVVLLAGTARPGAVGNAYIVGHSSNYKNAPGGFNDIFKNLPNIRVGDTIKVFVGKTEYDYVVYETRTVLPTELWVESQETAGAKVLTLQTSYPVGTANKRFVAIAKMGN